MDRGSGSDAEEVRCGGGAVDPEGLKSKVGGAGDVPEVGGDEADVFTRNVEAIDSGLIDAGIGFVNTKRVYAQQVFKSLAEAIGCHDSTEHSRGAVGEDG